MAKEKKKQNELSELPGVGPTTEEKLKLNGYSKIINIATASPEKLEAVTGISEPGCRKIIQAAREMMDMDFKTADKVSKDQEENIKSISLKCKAFDDLLHGGVKTGWITEAFAAWGAGKTQVAFQLCCSVQLPVEQGGLGEDSKVVYIDTESTFVASRVSQIATALGQNSDKILKNILYVKVFSADHQKFACEKISELINDGENIKLIVVDSLTAHYRAEYTGREHLYLRQQKLNEMMHVLLALAIQYNLAVFVTNQVMSNPAGFYGDPTVAVGGNIIGHNSTIRLYLRKGAKGTRIAKLVDSPHMPDGEAAFIITEEGIKDIE